MKMSSNGIRLSATMTREVAVPPVDSAAAEKSLHCFGTQGGDGMNLKSEDRERPERFCPYHEVWEALSCAIIKTACDDYKVYMGKGRQRIEKFIRSDYFTRISNVDPDWLINHLRQFKPRI